MLESGIAAKASSRAALSTDEHAGAVVGAGVVGTVVASGVVASGVVDPGVVASGVVVGGAKSQVQYSHRLSGSVV